jgi:hypothetical protein
MERYEGSIEFRTQQPDGTWGIYRRHKISARLSCEDGKYLFSGEFDYLSHEGTYRYGIAVRDAEGLLGHYTAFGPNKYSLEGSFFNELYEFHKNHMEMKGDWNEKGKVYKFHMRASLKE